MNVEIHTVNYGGGNCCSEVKNITISHIPTFTQDLNTEGSKSFKCSKIGEYWVGYIFDKEFKIKSTTPN